MGEDQPLVPCQQAVSHRACKPHKQGKSEQISRAEYVTEDAWFRQCPHRSIIWILFKAAEGSPGCTGRLGCLSRSLFGEAIQCPVICHPHNEPVDLSVLGIDF